MFGKIFITQLRNCVMLVTPLFDDQLEAIVDLKCYFYTDEFRKTHGWDGSNDVILLPPPKPEVMFSLCLFVCLFVC